MPGGRRASLADNTSASRTKTVAAIGACLLTAAGGGMDAWVYLAHGHVFANAQTGNIVLLAIDLAAGDWGGAARVVPSILAFIAGLLLSQLAGAWLRMAGLNARNTRLVAECAMLLVLALSVGALPDHVVAASVGFIAAVQITSLSRIGEATFNTGMTTGNLRGAVSAAVATWINPTSVRDRDRFVTLWLLCLAFPAGALLGGVGARLLGDKTAFIIAGLVACSVIVMWRTPDPLPPT